MRFACRERACELDESDRAPAAMKRAVAVLERTFSLTELRGRVRT